MVSKVKKPIFPIMIISALLLGAVFLLSARPASAQIDVRIIPSAEEISSLEKIFYTVNYHNLSGQKMEKVILEVAFPETISFRRASEGEFSRDGNKLTADLGELSFNEEGVVKIKTRLSDGAKKDLLVAARLIYTKSSSGEQGYHQAYAMVKVKEKEEKGKNLAVGAIFSSDSFFFPGNFLEWFASFLVIVGIILMGWKLYGKEAVLSPLEENKKEPLTKIQDNAWDKILG